ncbi:MAG: TOBE domain-containing protein [Nevskiales bacterium]
MKPEKAAIEMRGLLWMSVAGENLGGPGRIDLLEKIAECGSITHAAKAMKISYKAAWDAVDAMNNLAGEPLVERLAGGKGGGSTRLTRRGAQLVGNFRLIEREQRLFVEQLSRHAAGIAADCLLLQRLNMRTSARNQYLGKVSAILRGAVNDEVELAIVGGQKIVAIVTHESVAGLGLAVGVEAFALIKASSIILVTADEGARFSARNRLTGTVSRLQKGKVNSEVVIDLPGGGSIAAVVTCASSDALGLAVGAPASAIFKASSVILGIPA